MMLMMMMMMMMMTRVQVDFQEKQVIILYIVYCDTFFNYTFNLNLTRMTG